MSTNAYSLFGYHIVNNAVVVKTVCATRLPHGGPYERVGRFGCSVSINRGSTRGPGGSLKERGGLACLDSSQLSFTLSSAAYSISVGRQNGTLYLETLSRRDIWISDCSGEWFLAFFFFSVLFRAPS